MESDEWVCDFAFAVNITLKLTESNIKLQGKGVFAHELYLEVKASQTKHFIFLPFSSKSKIFLIFLCWKHELSHKH